MKMLPISSKPSVGYSTGIEETVMGMNPEKANIASFYLRDKIYSDKPMAIIREYICNALDEHEKYNVEIPVDVKLYRDETDNQYYLSIRDYARGLDDHSVRHIFGQLFESTKDSDNNLTGGFGIGSKSAHSYSDSFEIRSHHNGTQTYYLATLESDAQSLVPVGKIRNLGSKDTKETGIEILVPIKEGDVYKFKSSLENYISWINPNIKIQIELDTYVEYLTDSCKIVPSKETLMAEFGDVKIYSSEREDLPLASTHTFSEIKFRMGNCSYPFTPNYHSIAYKLYGPVVIEVPVGYFSIPLSREHLEETENNKKKIDAIIEVMENNYEEVKDSVIINGGEIFEELLMKDWWTFKRKDIVYSGGYVVYSPEFDKSKTNKTVFILSPRNNRGSYWRSKLISELNRAKIPENIAVQIISLEENKFDDFKNHVETCDKFVGDFEVYSGRNLKPFFKSIGSTKTEEKIPLSEREYLVEYNNIKNKWTPEEFISQYFDGVQIPVLEDFKSTIELSKFLVGTKEDSWRYPSNIIVGSKTMRKLLAKGGLYLVEDDKVKEVFDKLRKKEQKESRMVSLIYDYNHTLKYIPNITIKSSPVSEKRADRLIKRLNTINTYLKSVEKEKTVRRDIIYNISGYGNRMNRKTLRKVLHLKEKI